MKYNLEKIKPDYKFPDFDDHLSNDIMNEFIQATDEGLDVKQYENLFKEVASMPTGEVKTKLSHVLYETVMTSDMVEGYKYNEPSTLEEIKALRKKYNINTDTPDEKALKSKIEGAWVGRICGCLLGKAVEGIRSDEMIPLLKETNNYPMYRYINQSDITEEMCERYKFWLRNKCYADITHGMPIDDDTNYMVLYQKIIDEFGKDFTSFDVMKAWTRYMPVNQCFTAERVAYKNFISGFTPPISAVYKNPYREWIGAQIRGDYFGYINPGCPEKAAEMAFRDASVSHVKNGIYGEMFVSAMISAAAVTDNIEDIIFAGLGEIPYTSRLYESIMSVVEDYRNGKEKEDVINRIHKEYDEHTGYGWCHTIPNAMIVVSSLLYGENDYGKSICMAVQACFDTDCNAATVGSILGMKNGIDSIGSEWSKPLENTIHTAVFGLETVKITDCVELNLKHI